MHSTAGEIRIVHLPGAALHALAEGDLTAAIALSPVAPSAYLAGPECRGLWRMRDAQVAQDPASAGWVTGIVWDESRGRAVGAAGFHAPPDRSGMVEIGYRIDPHQRRQGYARAALEALLARGSPGTPRPAGTGQHPTRQPGVIATGAAVRLQPGRRAVGRRGRAGTRL
ncbi:GNAT family N-acetyltransferase [Actinoplanes sp. NPDC051859]|uniref:GNAT family N-acetyltransferase n=1 Tax=Actinoplanes sp. NPDC051859 TaxID=3363909 RepID=UPI0037BC5456